MESRAPEFFSALSKGIASLLNEVLEEKGLSIFRRAPQVTLGPSGTAPGFTLSLLKWSETEENKGTFSLQASDERFLVFRHPSRMTVTFRLRGQGLSTQAQLKALDRLSAHFFDQRSIEPILPGSLQAYPSLYSRLRNRAEIRMRQAEGDGDGLELIFDYVALYHSGNPLREEQKAKQRVIEYSNDGSERSVP